MTFLTISGSGSRWGWSALLFLGVLFLSGSSSFLLADALDTKERQLADRIQAEYGARAARRVIDWRLLIQRANAEQWSKQQALEETNRFFNRQIFIDDIKLWGQNDYWASPAEFLAVGGGDCEDFSIAKYFTLREMGFTDESLRLIYVKAIRGC